MVDLEILDKTYQFVTRSFVERGIAPHFIEVAKELAVSMEEGRQALYSLAGSGIPMWLSSGTDQIASMAPFSNLPNHYPITIAGKQRWYGQ